MFFHLIDEITLEIEVINLCALKFYES